MSHYNFVHKSVPSSDEIRDAKAAADKEWKKPKTWPAWQLDKMKSKKEVILEARRDKKKVHSATLKDMCHLKKCGVRTQISEVQRSIPSPRRHCKRRLWSRCGLY